MTRTTHGSGPRRRRRLRLLLAATLTLLAAALGGGCSGGGKQTVVVLGPWTGNEAAAFTRTLDLLDNGTPYTYSYQGTSSLRETLVAQLEADAPPDVAILNSQGELQEYAREGALTPLTGDLASRAYPPWAPELVVNGARHTYWVPLKVDIKSLVWTRTTQPVRPHSWCLGMSAQATTGWPGTDWIEDILLHRSGPDRYEQWATGVLPWTSPEVRDAWSTWASLMAGQNTRSALDIPYTGEGGKGLLNSGTCTEEHAGTFIRYLYGPDITFRPSADTIPGLGGHKDAYEVSADMAAVFRDSPAAMQLLSNWPPRGAQDLDGTGRTEAETALPQRVGPPAHRPARPAGGDAPHRRNERGADARAVLRRLGHHAAHSARRLPARGAEIPQHTRQRHPEQTAGAARTGTPQTDGHRPAAGRVREPGILEPAVW